MRISRLFNTKTVLSYEVFPPKPTSPVGSIYETIEELSLLSPDYISVTCGAGGGGRADETLRIADTVSRHGIVCATHLTCVGQTAESLSAQLDRLKRLGIENILALRGDLPADGQLDGDFRHADELVAFIRERGGFCVSAACYPEVHTEAKSAEDDLRRLRGKVNAGAEYLITQLFLDNDFFYSFLRRCRASGITVPIEAGIMPVVNKKQILRMTSLCGASLPAKFVAMIDRYGDDPVAMRDAGIAYATDQIIDLLAHGVDGIHLYTMNNPYIARRIYESVHNLLPAITRGA